MSNYNIKLTLNCVISKTGVLQDSGSCTITQKDLRIYEISAYSMILNVYRSSTVK